MPPRTAGPRLATAVVILLGALLAVLLWLLTPWHPLPGAEAGSASLAKYFTRAEIARSAAFHDAIEEPVWWSLAVGIAVPVALGCTPLARRLVAFVTARSSREPLQVAALCAAVVIVQRLATLPFDARAHSVAHSYGLSTQSWAGWFADVSKSTGIRLVLTSLVLLGLVAIARRFPSTWYAFAGLAAAVLVVVGSFVYPVLLEPVFNRFQPLPAGALHTRLLALANREGVAVDEILVADASRRTTARNAYVSGFGVSRRVVVYDTLLQSSTDDQVASVVAHELGHAARNDVTVGTAEGAVAAALGATVLFLLLRSPAVRRPAGARSAGDPAVVPLVLALAAVVGFVALPVQNLISRQVEARADVVALDLTRDPAGFIAVQRQLAVSNLSSLRPDPVVAFWFSTHPDPLARIESALQWRRLHQGGAP